MILHDGFLQLLNKALLTIVVAAGFLCLLSPASHATELFDQSYILGVDDVIKISVYGEKDLSNTYRIAKDGTVSIPLIGDVMVKGRSVPQAQEDITALLMDGYLIDPSVSVEVVQYRPFYIMGEVEKPGSYPYVSDINMLGAVAQAGGFTYRAKRNEVRVLRAAKDTASAYQMLDIQNRVMPGDIIVVKERLF